MQTFYSAVPRDCPRSPSITQMGIGESHTDTIEYIRPLRQPRARLSEGRSSFANLGRRRLRVCRVQSYARRWRRASAHASTHRDDHAHENIIASARIPLGPNSQCSSSCALLKHASAVMTRLAFSPMVTWSFSSQSLAAAWKHLPPQRTSSAVRGPKSHWGALT